MSSAAPKKKAFDRGGPVWPPRSNAKYDRFGGGAGAVREIFQHIPCTDFSMLLGLFVGWFACLGAGWLAGLMSAG